ncbi:MAG: bifunctional demethylmenaquinone methyltransferase/2-methoxy-6-polyprenyl-1,4-benzoquinol methylase UbiE [Rickettsiaceae bacterium]
MFDLSNKKQLVHNIFSDVAEKYDLMNDVMSFGIHRFWKKALCSQIPNLNSKILDVASGSGDIAFRIYKDAKKQNKDIHITLCDINQAMLDLSLSKAIDNNIIKNIEYICADAENLPFENCKFDYYVIAFGIRNVSNIDNVLNEAYRVLKPGGKFLCLEFSKPKNYCFEQLYQLYKGKIIPKIGKMITNNQEAYEYLSDSISLFPEQNTFKNMIQDASFSKAQYQNLLNGIAAIHTAYKLT